VQDRFGKRRQLLDIGNMRGLENPQRGARDPAVDELRRRGQPSASITGMVR
jgi:hypothetical protein